MLRHTYTSHRLAPATARLRQRRPVLMDGVDGWMADGTAPLGHKVLACSIFPLLRLRSSVGGATTALWPPLTGHRPRSRIHLAKAEPGLRRSKPYSVSVLQPEYAGGQVSPSESGLAWGKVSSEWLLARHL